MSSDAPEVFSVAQLFTERRYRIPLYQRAYAWSGAEIHTLIADIHDARIDSENAADMSFRRDYYLGSLVVDVHRRDDQRIDEVVDGQQRLTTLFILLCLAPRRLGVDVDGRGSVDEHGLTFEGRDAAAEDLRRLARHGRRAIATLRTDGIKHAAELILKAVDTVPDEAEPRVLSAQAVSVTAKDMHYLLDHVKILRTELPPNTDLNHYFEVMNTRGEQLEKHEILKAKLIGHLPGPEDRRIFSRIWEASSVLDRHVQTQFSTEKLDGQVSERERLFGGIWDAFSPSSAIELYSHLGGRPTGESEGRPSSPQADDAEPYGQGSVLLTDVLHGNGHADNRAGSDDETDRESGSYGTLLDFPHLLLHALKIHRREKHSWINPQDSGDIPTRLDDKYLLEEFDRALRGLSGEIGAWVRDFSYVLLRVRYLMDTYVIRTQPTIAGEDEENWVLVQAYKYTSRGRKKTQLSTRSTFDVKSLDDDSGRSSTEARRHRQILLLQSMFQVTDTRRPAKYFVFRMLAWLHSHESTGQVDGKRFVELLESMAQERLRSLDHRRTMDEGTNVHNFLFNVLDYSLWKAGTEGLDGSLSPGALDDPCTRRVLDSSAAEFRFRYRNSVEHFYPAHPSEEQGHEPLEDPVGNSFGNLCIMSRSENSRRNNLMPLAKAKEFRSTGQSLKFQVMAEIAERCGDWDAPQISTHGTTMLEVLDHVTGQGTPPRPSSDAPSVPSPR